MADLYVAPYDEVYVTLSGEPGIIEELAEHFTFEVPGCRFTPLYKQKLWDGKIRLYKRVHSLLYRGLLPYIQRFCEERDYLCACDPILLKVEAFNTEDALAFAQSLCLPHAPRSYQLEAFARAIQYQRQLIVSPTASGKSLILYLIVRYLMVHEVQKVLLIVPTTNLVEQLYKDFESYGWSPDAFVHRQYEGHAKHTDKFLTISTWQSIYTLPPSYFLQFGAVLGDECHQYKSKSLKLIMESTQRARYRIGCTGTLDGTKTHAIVLEGLFGTIYRATTTKALMDAKHISSLTIKCLVLKYSKEDAKAAAKLEYPDEMKFILDHAARMRVVTNLALSLKGNTLVLFQFVARHGEFLFTGLKAASDSGRKVFFVFGGTETEEREKIREIVAQEENALVIASYGTFSTGINIPRLHNVIFSSPSKSVIRVLQSIGRGLRRTEDKETMTLYDIVDDLRSGRHTNFTLKHFMKRVDIYNAEQFSYKLFPIDLP
jgi:superfamily II DNA or RNA helicase